MFNKVFASGAMVLALSTAGLAEVKYSVDSDGNVLAVLFPTDVVELGDYAVYFDMGDGDLVQFEMGTTGVLPDTIDVRGSTFSVAPDGEALVLTNVETGQEFRSTTAVAKPGVNPKRYGLD